MDLIEAPGPDARRTRRLKRWFDVAWASRYVGVKRTVGAAMFESLEPRVMLDGSSVPVANPGPGLNDYFGSALAAVDATRLLIGAYADDTGAVDSGAAYMVSATDGSLVRTFNNPSPAVNAQFGWAVATLGGGRIAISAPRDNTKAVQAGAVYIFDTTTGDLVRTITRADGAAYDQFGLSLAAVGTNKLLVGSYIGGGITYAGAATLIDADTGETLQTFLEPAPAAGNLFGASVAAIGSDKVLIGAPGSDSLAAADSGIAYVFNANTGALLLTVPNPSPADADSFGQSLAAVGAGMFVVGAPNKSTGATLSGAAYVFDAATGNLLRTIVNPTPADTDFFGRAVAGVGGDRVLIAAANDDSAGLNSGSAYLFEADTGLLLKTYVDPVPNANDQFGVAVTSVTPDLVAIGTPGADGGAINAGAAHVLDAVVPAPTLASLTADANPATLGSTVNLTASGVSATGRRVLFYVDSNNNGQLDPGSDLLLASRSVGGGVATLALETSLFSPTGAFTVFALPTDSRGVTGNAATLVLNVTDATLPAGHPTLGGLVASPATVPPNTPVTLVANNVNTTLGALNNVDFFIDTNNNGAFDVFADTLLGTDNSGADGWSLTVNSNALAINNGRVFARAKSSLGKYSKPATTVVVVQGSANNAAPSVALSAPVNNFTTTNSTPRFSWVAEDPEGDPLNHQLDISDGAGRVVLSVRINDTATQDYTLKSTQALAPDTYVWRVTVSDDHGNTTESAPRQLIVTGAPPNEAPTVSLLLPAANAIVASQTPTFTWSASDPDGDPLLFDVTITTLAGAVVRSASLNNPASYAFTIADNNPLPLGTYLWSVVASDGQGHSTPSGTRQVTLGDGANTPPVVSLLTPADAATIDTATPTFTWDATDADNDPLAFTLTITTASGGPVNSFALGALTTLAYSLPADAALAAGEYQWTIAADDGRGSPTVSAARAFTLPGPANNEPVVTPLTPLSDERVPSPTPVFTWTAADADNDALTGTLEIRDEADTLVRSIALPDAMTGTASLAADAALTPGFYTWTLVVSDGKATVTTTPRPFSLARGATIEGVDAVPADLAPGDAIALTARGVASDAGPVVAVEYFLDLNGNRAIDPESDPLLGSATNPDNAWRLAPSTIAWPTGAFAILARATTDWAIYSVTVAADINVLGGGGGAEPATIDVTLSAGGPRTLAFVDGDGSRVTLTLKSADAVVSLAYDGAIPTTQTKSGVVTVTGDTLTLNTVALRNGSAKSKLTVTAKKGDKAAGVEHLLIDGDFGTIAAAPLDLAGELTATGVVGSLTLRDVRPDSAITLGGTPDTKTRPAIKLNHVADATLASGARLASLSVNSWTDAGGGGDTVVAPSIGKLAAKSAFAASLTLGQAPPKGDTLGGAAVGGAILAGDWQITGGAGAITAAEIDDAWSLVVTGNLKSLKSAGNAGGNLAAAKIGSLTVGKAWTGGTIRVTQPFADKQASLDKLTIAGLASNLTLRSAGSLGVLAIGAIAGSKIFVGLADAQNAAPTDSDEFLAPDAAITSLTLKGLKKPATPSLANSIIAAGVLKKVVLRDVVVENNDAEFGFYGDTVNAYRRTGAGVKITSPVTIGLADASNDFVLRLL